MNQRGIAANEIHADRGGDLINRARQINRVAGGALRNHRDRSYRDSLVRDANPKFVADRVDSFNQGVGEAVDLLRDAFGGALDCFAGAVAQTQPQRHGADIEVFHFRHGDGLENFGLRVFHKNRCRRSDVRYQPAYLLKSGRERPLAVWSSSSNDNFIQQNNHQEQNEDDHSDQHKAQAGIVTRFIQNHVRDLPHFLYSINHVAFNIACQRSGAL